MSRPGARRKSWVKSMDQKFRWGILGAASIARVLIKAIKQSQNGEVAAIASRSGDKAKQWAKEFEIPRHFGSYQTLLDCPDLDGVYIPLPNRLHAEWTVRALRAGLPVLCEKPIAVNARETEQIHEAATSAGRYVAEAFMYRFHPVYPKIREIIRAGEIGKVSTIFSRFTFLLEDRSQVPASAELAGGALMDVGCYCVNASRLLAGAEPRRVCAFERRSDVDDTMVGLLEFPDGVLAQFETSIENFERHRVEISGDLGAIQLEDPWVPGIRDKELTLKKPGRPDRKILVPGQDTYILEVEEFVDVCRKQATPTWTFEDSIKNMRVIDALFLSAKTGKAILI